MGLELGNMQGLAVSMCPRSMSAAACSDSNVQLQLPVVSTLRTQDLLSGKYLSVCPNHHKSPFVMLYWADIVLRPTMTSNLIERSIQMGLRICIDIVKLIFILGPLMYVPHVEGCSMCLFVFKAAGPWYTLIYNIFHTFERAHHIFTISSSLEPLP